jgi:prepilin-type processing-associated H-X9-DG protein
MASVIDGLSNTLFAGDKRINRTRLGTYQNDDNEGYTAGWDHDTIRTTDKSPQPDLTSGTGDGNQRFGSSHTGGFNALFGDGSVRFIRYTIDITTFRRLGIINDGQVVVN